MKRLKKKLLGILGTFLLAATLIAVMPGKTDISPPAQTGTITEAPSGALNVHILDVGQGLSVLIQANETTLLYDGGDGNASSFVVSYLKKQGIEKLDYIIASHYDADHLAGIIGTMNAFEVGILLAPDYETDTQTYDSFLRMAAEKEIAITNPCVNQIYSLGPGSFQILAPAGFEYEDENDHSIVLRVTIGDSSLLLTGDAAAVSEIEMLQSHNDLNSDVLVVGHHGSYNSTSEDFLETVSPKYAIISCGQYNDYGHPAKRVVELLESEEITLYRTDLQGTIQFAMTGTDITFKADPCGDYSSGEELAARLADSDFNALGFTYILNTNSRKFHLPECESVTKMSAKNKKGTHQTRQALIATGYTPCGSCNP